MKMTVKVFAEIFLYCYGIILSYGMVPKLPSQKLMYGQPEKDVSKTGYFALPEKTYNNSEFPLRQFSEINTTYKQNGSIEGSDADSSLEITLTSFSASYTQTDGSVHVQWTVASQMNNKLFVVEKTTDGNTWMQVGTEYGAGTTSFSNNYILLDKYPLPEISYYRLKQIGFDGQQTTFAPVVVNMVVSHLCITLYPNPVCSDATLNFCSPDYRNITITLHDESGKMMERYTTTKYIAPGYNIVSINTCHLQYGAYFFLIEDNCGKQCIKFLKAR